MNSERWGRIAELYQAASLRAPAERQVFLANACTGDAELQREVESLLEQPVSQDGLLECVANEVLGFQQAIELDGATEPSLPSAIGRYRVLRLIGTGGMGMVFEAEQDHPRRVVALKVIKPGLGGSELVRRFERESEALGRLQHPGIAQIYEAGEAQTAFGMQPYFAMEYIRGLSLLEYAAAHRLSARQRVEVMVKVCEAAHHAHERGIIHRDLKPGNILVDEAGQPKILDFGVARVADGDALVTRQTDLGELLGTLAYMSPEQVLTEPVELDARSDVYTLGVVLYELLAGRLPYTIGPRLFETAQTIREEEAAPLGREYQGDLEAIVQSALEKDKFRRYGSAAQLAADLGRYLADKPILARRPSAAYQARKFVSRHKRLVVAAVAVFAVLVAGTAASTWEAIRASRAERVALVERDRVAAAQRAATAEKDRAVRAEQAATRERIAAEQERNRAIDESKRADTQSAVAQAVNDFLQNDLLAQAGARAQAAPKTRPDPGLTVRGALDRAAAKIDGKFESQPLVEASIRQSIGNAYRDLGLLAEAQTHMERAFDLRRRVLGPEHADTLSSMQELGVLYLKQAKYAAADALLTAVLKQQRRLHGSDRPETLAATHELATLIVARGDHARAESLLLRVLEGYRRLFGEEHPDTLATMNDLAAQYTNRGKYALAEQLYQKTVEIKRRVVGADHPSTLLSMNSLAVVYRNQGKYSEAEALLTAALNMRRQAMGDQHPDTAASMNSLALLYMAQARYSQAEPLLTRALEATHQAMGEDNPDTLRIMNSLAELYRRQERPDQAEPLFQKVLAMRRRVLGSTHPNTTNVMASFGEMKIEQRRYAEAESLLREAVNGQEMTSPDTWRRYYTQTMLGLSVARLGRYAEAEPLMVSGYEGMVRRRDAIPYENRPLLQKAREWTVQLYEAWGRTSEAAKWRDGTRLPSR